MKKTSKQNNKGFSLVELIIVIAIMAVLVGVLAPAFLRYVEKSRKSADVQAFDSIMSAMEATAIDPQVNMAEGNTIVATFTNGVLAITCTNNGVAESEMKDTVGAYTLKSTDWKAIPTITLTGEVAKGGRVKFTLTEDDKNSITGYSNPLKTKIENSQK